MLILLQAPVVSRGECKIPDGFTLRPAHPDDIEALGQLYFAAYDADVGCASEAEAVADIRASFAGTYGDLWIEASPVILFQGSIVSALQTVVSAPWSDLPPGPFITELFTDRDYRRRGLANAMLRSAMSTMDRDGCTSVSLRVQESNSAARVLYASLGFRQVIQN